MTRAAGSSIVSMVSQVWPLSTRITPKHAGSEPQPEALPPSTQLYVTITISPAAPESCGKSDASGVVRTLMWSGNASPGGGASHSHCTSGSNKPMTTSPKHASLTWPGLNGTHQPSVSPLGKQPSAQQNVSPVHCALSVHMPSGSVHTPLAHTCSPGHSDVAMHVCPMGPVSSEPTSPLPSGSSVVVTPVVEVAFVVPPLPGLIPVVGSVPPSRWPPSSGQPLSKPRTAAAAKRATPRDAMSMSKLIIRSPAPRATIVLQAETPDGARISDPVAAPLTGRGCGRTLRPCRIGQ